MYPLKIIIKVIMHEALYIDIMRTVIGIMISKMIRSVVSGVGYRVSEDTATVLCWIHELISQIRSLQTLIISIVNWMLISRFWIIDELMMEENLLFILRLAAFGISGLSLIPSYLDGYIPHLYFLYINGRRSAHAQP